MIKVIRVKRVLGILVHQILDPNKFLPLLVIAQEEGFDDTMVFTPDDVNLSKQLVTGYVMRDGEWQQLILPFPSITFDIGYYTGESSIKVKKIKEHPKFPFIGYSLGNKWTIQKHLMAAKPLSPYLLPTEMASHEKVILSMAKQHQSVMLKPLNGSGGKGIFRINRLPNGYQLGEHEDTLSLYSEQQIREMLHHLIENRKYIVQKWVDIRDRQGSVYDIRVLVQKNHVGQWQLTGMGIRQGESKKITSNLTGGGQAFQVYPFLKEQFGEASAKKLIHQMERIALFIPRHLEKGYKKRLAELGLDLAVDRDQHIWIIEVNIKPGKTLWRKISDFEADRMCLRAPIQYGRFLLQQMGRKR